MKAETARISTRALHHPATSPMKPIRVISAWRARHEGAGGAAMAATNDGEAIWLRILGSLGGVARKATTSRRKIDKCAHPGLTAGDRCFYIWGHFSRSSTFCYEVPVRAIRDAYEVYVDHVRELSNVGVARVNGAVSFVSAKAAEGFDALRDGLAKVVPVHSQAA